MNKNSRGGVPPRRENVFYIRSPKALESFKFTIYSEVIQPVYTHFTPDGTRPCYKNHELCQPKHSLLNLRWKGYLFGFDHDEKKVQFVQMTHEAANQLMDHLGEAATLRGLTIQVSRTKKNKGRMNCAIVDSWQSVDLRRIRPAPDVRLSLFNLWKIEPTKFPFSEGEDDLRENGPDFGIVG